jgi:2-desacetyl-2-hydroxyethyl bacteriochlorophyllide A dehydrogenase
LAGDRPKNKEQTGSHVNLLQPARWHPRIQLHAKGLLTGRRVISGVRVMFPAVRAASLERYFSLGPGPGELLVRNERSLVSPGTERALFMDAANAGARFPMTPGYSTAGRVLAVGPQVSDFAVGDRVVTSLGHSSAGVIRAARVTRIPAGVSDDDATFYSLALISLAGVYRAKPLAGETIAVVGRGLIGLLAVKLLRLAGGFHIVSVARSERNAGLAQACGADRVMRADDLTRLSADAVIDATGSPAALAHALTGIRAGGRLVVLGSPRGTTDGLPLHDISDGRTRILGAHIRALPDASDNPAVRTKQSCTEQFLRWLADGRLTMRDLISHRLAPDGISEFYQQLALDETGVVGAVIEWDKVDERDAWTAPDAARPLGEQFRPAQRITAWARRVAQDKKVMPPELSTSVGNVRFALIGCGAAAAQTGKGFVTAPSASLVAAMDVNPAMAESFARSFGVRATNSLDDVLKNPEVDAVFVGVPHFLHASIATRCAEAGKHIIMEKPLATSVADIDTMMAACRSNGVLLMANYSRRYEPDVAYARWLVEQGALGRFLGSCIVFGEEKRDSYWIDATSLRPNWRAKRHESGGGILANVMVHHLDYVGYIVGERVTDVNADYDSLHVPAGVEVEDSVSMYYRYANGALGTLVACSRCPGMQDYESFWGTEGQIQLLRDGARFFTRRPIAGFATGRWQDFPEQPNIDSRAVLIEKFARSILLGTAVDIVTENSREVTRIVEAAYACKTSENMTCSPALV